MSWQWGSVWPIWLLALAGAVLVGVFGPSDGVVWMPIVLGTCTFAACAVQLAGPSTPGIVDRLGAAVLGSFAILLVASLIMLPTVLV